jgi:meiotic recombination protein DMC1
MQVKEPEVIHQSFSELDKLLAFGINGGDLSKLKSAGVCTVLGVLMMTRKDLISIKGLSEGKVEKILEAAQKSENSTAFMSGIELNEKRKQVFKISTGSSALNNLLGGGIESMSITEAYGEFRCGKTQIALTLCVTALYPNYPEVSEEVQVKWHT